MRHARGGVALITSALLGYVLVTGALPAPGANGDAGQGRARAANLRELLDEVLETEQKTGS